MADLTLTFAASVEFSRMFLKDTRNQLSSSYTLLAQMSAIIYKTLQMNSHSRHTCPAHTHIRPTNQLCKAGTCSFRPIYTGVSTCSSQTQLHNKHTYVHRKHQLTACMHACNYVLCMRARTCMYICIYVCNYMYACVYVFMYQWRC